MAFAVFKVLVPFYRVDLSPIGVLHDLIFMDAVPYAVVEWANSIRGKSPSIMLRLEAEHLSKQTSAAFDYRYKRVMDQPQLRSW